MSIGQPKSQEAATSPRPEPEIGDLVGPISMTDLADRDPGKHYVFVSRNKHSLAEYRRMGYRPEIARDGGVHVAGDEHEAGREIECMDHVLMAVSKERHASIEQKGAFGQSGQERVDAFEKAVIDKRNVNDHFRGASVKNGVYLQNKTSALEEEV